MQKPVFKKKTQDVAKKGNLKDFFYTQEVPPYQKFTGIILGLEGFDPFEYAGEDELVIRVGLHRNGMVKLKKKKVLPPVRLNASTAALFDQELPVDRYCLHSLQLSPFMAPSEAAGELIQWK